MSDPGGSCDLCGVRDAVGWCWRCKKRALCFYCGPECEECLDDDEDEGDEEWRKQPQ